jgi:acetyl esterase/lipase
MTAPAEDAPMPFACHAFARAHTGRRSARVASLALGLVIGMVGPVLAGNNATTRFAVQPFKDIDYFDGAGSDPVRHKLDLYLPKGEKGYPVVFFVHGGSWRHGDKNFLGVYEALGTFLARQGIGAVVINYRLTPAVRHPEHIRDVARAFAWTHKNIATYGGRPDRIFVCGHSAGGHLVALLATDPKWLQSEKLTAGAIRGVIALSGVFDLSELPQWLVSATFGKAADVIAGASPVKQARGGLPPFLILYADRDLPGCDRKPAEYFAKALRSKGNKAETVEVPESNHFKVILSAVVPGDPVCDAILGFVAANAGTP